MTIEHELNQTFVTNLQSLLFSSITQEAASSPSRLEELVQESSGMAKRRKRLESRRMDLLKIKQKLDTFWSLTPTRRNHHSGSHHQAQALRRTRSASVSTDGNAGDYYSISASSDANYA